MKHQTLAVTLFGVFVFAPGCTNEPATDAEYLAQWRESQAEYDMSHVGGSWHFEFDSVRLYRVNWDTQHLGYPILSAGEFNDSRLPKEGILLNPDQIDRLEAAVTGTHTEFDLALCHYPHHAFVFFDADGNAVGSIDVCFLCGTHKANPKGFAKSWDLLSIAELIHDADVPIRNPKWFR